MAGFVGPEIPGVTDGLVAYYDAALTYTSGSTIWYDKINGNNGTLTNGPAYSTDGKGSIVFDGANDYVNGPLNYNNVINGFTTIVWLKPNTFSNPNAYNAIINRHGSTGHIFSHFIYTNGNMGGWIFTNTDTIIQGNTTLTLIEDEWNFCVWQAEDDIGHYRRLINSNGDNNQSISFSGTIRNDENATINIGRWHGSGYHYNGSIGTLSHYNYLLSPSEVLQNYNALKGRFGL